MRHNGGYTPFEADVTELVQPGAAHRLTACVNNELTWDTIPPRIVRPRADGGRTQHVFHDFFNYAGLHRSVWLYATPKAHIADIAVDPFFADGGGGADYRVTLSGSAICEVTLLDRDGAVVARSGETSGRLTVPRAVPWQPGAAYLYMMRVTSGEDIYELPVGLRTVRVEGTQLLINDVPFYFRGFGMHEDAAVRGKGHDDARMLNDFALMAWTGANSFRTWHYPYAEEVLDQASPSSSPNTASTRCRACTPPCPGCGPKSIRSNCWRCITASSMASRR